MDSCAASPQILLAGNRLARGPVARQRADQFAVLELRLGIAAPGGAAADLGGLQRGLSQACKISPPAFIDRIGVLEILGVERLNEGGIGAGEERRRLEQVIGAAGETVLGILTCHFKGLERGLLGPARSSCGIMPEGVACNAEQLPIQRLIGLNMGSIRPECDG